MPAQFSTDEPESPLVVMEPDTLYVRPSAKRPGEAVVVGVRTDDGPLRAVLVRHNSEAGTITVRLLDGDPSEKASEAVTQAVATLDLNDLSVDPNA